MVFHDLVGSDGVARCVIESLEVVNDKITSFLNRDTYTAGDGLECSETECSAVDVGLEVVLCT